MIKAGVIWITGLSGSGKTTIGSYLGRAIGGKVLLLDGDEMRGVFLNSNFDKRSRIEHNLTIARLAALFEKKGYLVIVCLISPYRDGRALCRNICKKFYEVYLNTPLSACEERDIKGLYAKARKGEIKNFTGIDDPYEEPLCPEVTINTHNRSVEYCADKIIHHLIKDI